MSLPLWKQSAPAAGQKEIESQPAEVVAERTEELLMTRGWCLWKCSAFGGEVIVVVRDETVEGFPKGHPTYTEAELEKLMAGNIRDSSLHLIHEAKKMGGAIIMDIENGGHDGQIQSG